MKSLKKTIVASAFLLIAPAMSFAGNKGAYTEPSTKVLKFEKGASALTQDQKTELSGLFKDSKLAGKELDVTMAVWADEPMPAKGKSLSDTQRSLADRRIKSIKEYVKSMKLDLDDLDSFSMAESSNWMARTFNTEGAQLKNQVAKKSKNDDLMQTKYKVIKSDGDVQKAVIVVSEDN